MSLLDMEYKHMVLIAVGLSILLTLLYRFDQRKRFREAIDSTKKLLAYELYAVLMILFVAILFIQLGWKGLEFYFTVIARPGSFYP